MWQPAAAQLVFKTGVNYVRVDVVVTDDSGRPVTGLSAKDFQIDEGGRRQEIADFQAMAASPPPTSEPVAAASDVASNIPLGPQGRLFVLVVDDLHIVESELIPVKRVMSRFIDELGSEDEAAIVFVGHSNDGQNFTADRTLLRKAVDRVRDALGFGLDALGRPAMSSSVTYDPRLMLQAARSADQVLKNVAESLAGASHPRRAIVYLTSGSILPTVMTPGSLLPDDYEDLQAAYRAARDAGVPIYTLDPRGQALPEDAVRGGISGVAVQGESNDVAVRYRGRIVQNTQRQQKRLAEIAFTTGGLAFTQHPDIVRAMKEVISDNASYYVLGYYPQPFVADGKFHEIRVRVNRPGVNVRARPGYVAAAATTTASPESTLQAAIKLGVNVSSLPLRAFAAPLTPAGKNMRTAITVEVDYPVGPTPESRQIDDEFLFTVVALDPDARVRAKSERILKVKGTAPAQGPLTFLIDDVVELPTQQLILRIGVASRSLGKAGTVQLSANVPKVGTDAVVLTPVVVGLAGKPLPALNASALQAELPFQPVAQRTFRASDRLLLCANVFSKSKSVEVAVNVGDATKSASLTTVTVPPGQKFVVWTTEVPLAGLAPGAHVVQITATSPDGRSASRSLPISIR
jgi:VWFA-related protein